jgi:hypothetical protein
MDAALYDRCCGDRPHVARKHLCPRSRRYSVQCESCGDTVEVGRTVDLMTTWNKRKRAERVKA